MCLQDPLSILPKPLAGMNDKSTTVELAARYQKALRSIAGGSLRGYTYPICCGSFEASPELWEHAWQAHPGSPEVTGDGGESEGEAKRRFVERAYVIAGSPFRGCGAIRVFAPPPFVSQE